MKQFLFIVLTFYTTAISLKAQQGKVYTDPQLQFKDAQYFYQKGMYSLAYPLFKELQLNLKETQQINFPITSQDIQYYTLACALQLGESLAEGKARDFINVEKNQQRVQMLHFHLGQYYFRKQDFARAVEHYEQTGDANLNEDDLVIKQFNQAYSYFYLQRFAQAKPLFNVVRNIKVAPNYLDANYYYGFLSFREGQFSEALNSLKLVENEEAYAKIVPYYIAQIYYMQGRKEEALKYAETKIKSGNAQYYDVEMKGMVGHAYFETKEYDKALPYLEDFIKNSEKVRREDLYELSYAYYQNNQLEKAVQGFKQLSGKEDTLSQNAMYLLGDAYIRMNQKANARSAFLFCASNSSNKVQQEISKFLYAKLSYELGYIDDALTGFKSFNEQYPKSAYIAESKDLLVAVLTNTSNYKEALKLIEEMKPPTENAQRLYPKVLYGRAVELINDENIGGAVAMLDKVLKAPYNTPVEPLASFWRGELAYRTQQPDDAIRYINRYIEGGAPVSGEANMANASYTLGYVYLYKENYELARNYFEKVAVNVKVESPEIVQDAYARLADTYYMERNFTKAKSLYDNIVKFSWVDEDYALYQNAMIAGIKNSKEKITLLSTVIRRFPDTYLLSDANMEIANTYMADEQFSQAVPYLQGVLKSNNTSYYPKAMLKLGTVYFNLNNNQGAISQFNELVTKYPNSAEAEDALDNIKAIYLEEGKTQEYADYMKKAGKPLSVSTEDSLTYSAAEAQLANGNTAAAITALSNYIKKFPSGAYSLEAYYTLGDIYLGQKKYNEALANLEIVAQNAPNPFAERALLEVARIYFFENKNYVSAEKYFKMLNAEATTQQNKLEAMRGLLRSQYQLKKWTEASENAKALMEAKGSSGEDKALAAMAVGKSYQVNQQFGEAINTFKQVINLNKAALAAEARYEIAQCHFTLNRLTDAETAAFEVIKKSGSNDYWVTRAYILLGDIYFAQKDYFNAKATFQSIVSNTLDMQLKKEAEEKLDKVTREEAKSSKVE